MAAVMANISLHSRAALRSLVADDDDVASRSVILVDASMAALPSNTRAGPSKDMVSNPAS
jgi:hypothetical protein